MSRAALRRHRRQAKIRKRVRRLRTYWGGFAKDSMWVRESGRLAKFVMPTRCTKHCCRNRLRGTFLRDELEGFEGVLAKHNRVLRSPQFSAAERRGGWPGTHLAAGSMPDEDRIPKVWRVYAGRHYIRVGHKIVCVTDSYDEALNVMYGVRLRRRVRVPEQSR